MQQAMGKYTSNFGSARTSPSDINKNGVGKYDVQNLSYPEDLFSSDGNRYGGHYTIFYINVAEDSKLIKDNKAETVDISADERLKASINQIGINTKNAIAGSTILGAAAGTILGALGGGGGSGGVTGTLLGGAAASVVTAAAGGKMSRQQKRLKSAIALHTPNALNVRYSTTWNEDETGAFQAAAMLGEGGMKALSESIQNGSVNAQSLTGPAASVVTALALNAPGGVGSGLSAASGLAPNPKKEQIFKGVDFRTFTFEYQFSPRNEKELENVNRIIQTFKLHMHPEFKDAASFVFVYPSEFDICYYYNQGENKYLHRHASCVLKDMNINYTPNGMFTSFYNGAPTQITVQLTFVELAILTKDQILQGY
jgi:hypothetical protein